MEVEDPITATQRTYLARIQSNQRHLASMIEDVLSFAKVEAGRLSVTMETVRVCEVLGSLEPLIEPELRRKELSFTCDPGDPSLIVRADPEKLRQILVNLLANAMKFTTVHDRIGVGAVRDGDRIRIWVSDTGIGIPADHLERVFEPFFQVNHGRTRSHPGMGLGLAISRDFARAMGGDLRLESQPGIGTTASLELPTADADDVR
jgi:signal transduction histidine kinase